MLFDNIAVAEQGTVCGFDPQIILQVPAGTAAGTHTITCQIIKNDTQQVLGSSQTQINVGPSAPGDPEEPPKPKIVSVDIEPVSLSDKENQNRDTKIESSLDNNPDWAGGDKRIFPDWRTPNDIRNRRTVRVKVRTSDDTPDGTTIYFRSYDVDDPTDDNLQIDSTGPNGNDNRTENSYPLEGRLLTRTATTTAGVATVLFEVGMHPGNNYRIAASVDPISDSTFQPAAGSTSIIDADGQPLPTTISNPANAKVSLLLTVWRRFHIEVDSMGKVVDNQTAGRITGFTSLGNNQTELTTRSRVVDVGRFIGGTLYIDELAPLKVIGTSSIPVRPIPSIKIIVEGTFQSQDLENKSFTLVDDDDFNEDDANALDGDEDELIEELQNSTFSKMRDSDDREQNIYAAAFLRPTYDGGGDLSNNNEDIDKFSWNVDLALGSFEITSLLGELNMPPPAYRQSQSNETDNYWVVYCLLSYQGALEFDNDPDNELTIGGFTNAPLLGNEVSNAESVPEGGHGSLLFLEAMTDHDVSMLRNPGNHDDADEGSAFDYKARTAPQEIGHQFGLLGDIEIANAVQDFGVMDPVHTPVFVRQHLNILRWRVKSPGQP